VDNGLNPPAVTIKNKAAYKMPDKNVTLYAVWKPNTISVLYQTKSTLREKYKKWTPSAGIHKVPGGQKLNPKSHPSTKLDFLGWTMSRDGSGKKYVPGKKENRVFAKSSTLYAQYTIKVDYFFTYNTGNNLVSQSKWMQSLVKNFSPNLIENIDIQTAKDFVGKWNELAKKKDVDNLHIFVHSGLSETSNSPIIYMFKNAVMLDAGTSKTNKSFSDLKQISLMGKIYYNGCNGGTVGNGTSIARELATRTNGKKVKVAVNSGVSFGFPPRFLAGRRPRTEIDSKGRSIGYWADIDKNGKITNKGNSWYYNASDKQHENAKTNYPAGAFP